MSKTLEACAIDAQQLATPGRAIAAGPHAIKRQGQRAALHPVFGEYRRGVRVVVLHTQQGQSSLLGKLGSETCRVEIRVQVVRHDRRLDAKQLNHLRHRLIQEIANGSVVEITDVLRNESLITTCDADGILEPTADGQYRRAGERQLDRPWRVAAGATDELQAAGGNACHTVVTTGHDVTVVHQKGVGETVQTQ